MQEGEGNSRQRSCWPPRTVSADAGRGIFNGPRLLHLHENQRVILAQLSSIARGNNESPQLRRSPVQGNQGFKAPALAVDQGGNFSRAIQNRPQQCVVGIRDRSRYLIDQAAKRDQAAA